MCHVCSMKSVTVAWVFHTILRSFFGGVGQGCVLSIVVVSSRFHVGSVNMCLDEVQLLRIQT
jgi:hypothetical protein